MTQQRVYAVVDTETTGLGIPPDVLPVELAAVIVYKGVIYQSWTSLVNPGIPITPEASATHNLTAQDIADAPSLDDALADCAKFIGVADVLVAHNAEFDRPFYEKIADDRDWLCTLRLAQHLWPGLPSYKNNALRYRFKLPDTRFRSNATHRAMTDALITAELLVHEQRTAALHNHARNADELIALAASPIPIVTWPKGTHYGTKITELKGDYLSWVAYKSNMDADLKTAAIAELNRRQAPAV